MTSKELLDRLHEMKIPAKSHASMLADAYVEKIRKNLEPEIKARAGQLEDEEAAALAAEQAEEARRKAEEEAARRALLDAVAHFLRAQPKDVRIAFLRRYWYGDRVEDAARRLGWSVSKTKSVLFRTRNRLRAQLLKEGFL
mgnify:CR=1 FL=1